MIKPKNSTTISLVPQNEILSDEEEIPSKVVDIDNLLGINEDLKIYFHNFEEWVVVDKTLNSISEISLVDDAVEKPKDQKNPKKKKKSRI